MLAAAAAFTAVQLAAYVLPLLVPSSVRDDALMWQRYAMNVSHGYGISWNPGGPHAYGLTSTSYLLVVMGVRAIARAWTGPVQLALLASALSGLGWMVLSIDMIRVALRRNARWLRSSIVVLFLVFCWFARDRLVRHFVSGMDTVFVLAYLTTFLATLARYVQRPRRATLIVLLLIHTFAQLARPDLLLFTLPVVLLLTFVRPDSPSLSLRWRIGGAATSLVVVGLTAGACALYFGSAVPLPFYAKGTHLYGPEIYRKYAETPAKEWGPFVRALAGPMILSLAGVAARLRRRRDWTCMADVALLGAAWAYLAYYRFFVLQIVPYDSRFYVPSVPVFLYLSVRAIALFAPNRRLGDSGASARRLRRGHVVVALAVAALTVVLMRGRLYENWPPRFRWAESVERVYAESYFSGYVVCLDKVATLPDDVTIATTEVGFTGIMNAEKRVIDLAGLNDTEVAFHGLRPARFFAANKPDLIYLPHPDYREMLEAMLQDPTFKGEYRLFPRGALHATMDVAVKRDGPHAAVLDGIFERRSGVATN